MSGGNWKVVGGACDWRVEFEIGRGYCTFHADQFGHVVSYSYTAVSGVDDLFAVLKDILPVAREAVPPVAGRYGSRFSEHRRKFLKVVARELNKRQYFPVLS
jgi:hypothetical protein